LTVAAAATVATVATAAATGCLGMNMNMLLPPPHHTLFWPGSLPSVCGFHFGGVAISVVVGICGCNYSFNLQIILKWACERGARGVAQLKRIVCQLFALWVRIGSLRLFDFYKFLAQLKLK